MADNPFKKRQELDAEIAKLNAEMLKATGKEADKLMAKINKLVDKWNGLSKETEKWNKGIEDVFDNLEDIDDELRSIGNIVGKNTATYELQRKRIEQSAATLKAISIISKDNAKFNDKDRAGLMKIGQAYKDNLVSIANAEKLRVQGKITKEQELELIQQASEKYKETTSYIELTAEAAAEIAPLLGKMNTEVSSFGDLAKKSLGSIEQLDRVFQGFSGIPAMGEINTLLKTNIKDTLAWKAAIFAVGAALAKAAYDYFGTPIKAAMQIDKERKQNEIDTAREIGKLKTEAEFIPQQISQEKLEHEIEANEQIRKAQIDAQYAGERAANAFSAAMQSAAAEFRAASKTALFGKGLGSVGYGAAQLQMAGISAEKIAGAMSSAAAATGKMPTGKAAADMAIMAERTGTSVDDIAQITEHFQRIDGMSAEMSMNMAEGMRSMADQAGISLGNLMKEVAESSKEALGYQIKSGPALAKAVTYAQSMGVSFGDVAKAGKNMVMNYKDSIKAEMQLSSLLGEQVDLSEVRAKFAEGDTTGAMQALQAQGLDPAQMDMFQQEALSQALGGMDLQSLSKIATGTGKEAGPLKAADAGKGNQQFLGATQAAQASLQSEQASISAQQAVLDAELSKKIGEATLNDPAYAKHKEKLNEAAQSAASLAGAQKDAVLASKAYKEAMEKEMKLDFVSSLKEGIMGGLVAGLGGLGATVLDAGFGKIKGMFSKGGGAPAAGDDGGGGSNPIKDMAVGGAAAGADALIPGSGAVVESVAGQVEALEAPLEKAMTFGEKLKDLGKGLGGFIKEIGTGVGAAIKGVLQGLGQGLKSLASGLISLTPAIPVILAFGAALWMAAPALEAIAPPIMKVAEVIGVVLVEALRQAGPIITAIFEGIGSVIKSVGEAISGVITAVGDSLVKIGSIDAVNLMGVALALPVLAAGLLALGAAELINGIMGFIGSLFGGGGPTIWEKLMELGKSGPGLKQAADAVKVLAPAFVMLSDVEDGENLGDLMENLKSAMGVLDEKTQNLMKSMGPSMQQLGTGAYALGLVRSNPNLELLGSQIQTLLNTNTQSAITSGTPLIDKLGTTLNSFGTSTKGLADALFAANPQLMILLNTMNTFSQIAAGIDITTMALQNMASALANVSKINTSNLVKVPWDKMSGFSKSGGNFVLATSANNNFNVTQDTAKNIKDMTANSKIMMNLTKNIEALTKALFEKQATAPIVSIDGKKLNSATNRYAEYHKAQT